MYLIQGVLGSKNLINKSCLEHPISLGYTPFQTSLAILCPLAANLDCAVFVTLQGVIEYPYPQNTWRFLNSQKFVFTDHCNTTRMEGSFHSGQNGMTAFHSGRNGKLIPFRLEWNGHSILAGMKWSHSIPSGME